MGATVSHTLLFHSASLFCPLPVSASILPRPYLWQTKPLEFLSLRENSTVSHADADRHYKNQSSTVSSAQHGTKESLFQEKGYL